MQRHWSSVAPPLNLSLAAYVGFKPKPKARLAEQMTEDDLTRDMAEMERFFQGLG
jgi:hypothetical protein